MNPLCSVIPHLITMGVCQSRQNGGITVVILTKCRTEGVQKHVPGSVLSTIRQGLANMKSRGEIHPELSAHVSTHILMNSVSWIPLLAAF